MEIINFIGILSVTWLWVEGAASIQFLKHLINIGSLSNPKSLTLTVIQKLVNCSMCSGFWIGLAYYQNFLMACCVSISAELFQRLIKQIFSRI